MGKTRNGKAAVICTAIAFLLIVIAFTTPNWLETDGKLENPKFIKIGNLIKNIFILFMLLLYYFVLFSYYLYCLIIYFLI